MVQIIYSKIENEKIFFYFQIETKNRIYRLKRFTLPISKPLN